MVEDLLRSYTVEPRFLELEITETTAMKDVEHTLAIMHRLREMGLLFSIDDFGTGYSSLGYLNRMPVNTLKQMHLNVVAEGVETEEQLLELATMGCHEAQGYYFSRPVSMDEILRYLLNEKLGPRTTST
jgi:EAL domain-containing protein (putative c-di-GMP-specific phosphodiesterase class I)